MTRCRSSYRKTVACFPLLLHITVTMRYDRFALNYLIDVILLSHIVNVLIGIQYGKTRVQIQLAGTSLPESIQ